MKNYQMFIGGQWEVAHDTEDKTAAAVLTAIRESIQRIELESAYKDK